MRSKMIVVTTYQYHCNIGCEGWRQAQYWREWRYTGADFKISRYIT